MKYGGGNMYTFKTTCHKKRYNLVVNHAYNFTRVRSKIWKHYDRVKIVYFVNMLFNSVYMSYTPTFCYYVLFYFLHHDIYLNV